MEHAASNAAELRLIEYMYRGVNEVFTAEVTTRMGEPEHSDGL